MIFFASFYCKIRSQVKDSIPLPGRWRQTQSISIQLFKGCLPQILLGAFLNTLTHMIICPVHLFLNLTCINVHQPFFYVINCISKIQIVTVIYTLSFLVSCIIYSAGSNSKKWWKFMIILIECLAFLLT